MSLVADPVARLRIGALGTLPRLLRAEPSRETLDDYLAQGGYETLQDSEVLLEAIREAGLRGHGGAAFPTARKIDSVRNGSGTPVVVGNGEEGEPSSAKDRWLLRNRPHLVLDGLRLAGALVGTKALHLYLSDEASHNSVLRALDEVEGTGIFEQRVVVTKVAPAYVAGEESAVVQVLNGGPALPNEKPPRPFEQGVGGAPTLINNVETLANFPIIQRVGAAEFRSLGTDTSPGTFLLTITGINATGIYEAPYGITLRRVLEELGEDSAPITGFLMGGYFAGVLGRHALDIPLDYDSVSAAGSGLGCGAIGVITETSCPVAVSAGVMAYFARENAGQCGSCFNGTAAMSAVLDALHHHHAQPSDMDRLQHWAGFLRGRGACGTLDGATNVAAKLLREFPEQVADHLSGRCEICVAGAEVSDPPFAISRFGD